MNICPTKLQSTFFEIRLAVGRFGWIVGNGRVLPTANLSEKEEGIRPCYLLEMAMGIMMNKSIYKNFKIVQRIAMTEGML